MAEMEKDDFKFPDEVEVNAKDTKDEKIEFEIENSKGKTNKEFILTNYDNDNYYSEKLEEKLVISVKRYLGLKIEYDSDSDSDDE